MESDEKMIIEGIAFDNKSEYETAKKELETIQAIERKFPLGNPNVALSVYNKSVSKKSFKTVIGYMFLKRLRDTIVSCGLVSGDVLNPVPLVSGEKSEKSEKTEKSEKATNKGLSVNSDKYRLLYISEKKTKHILMAVVIALAISIIAIFAFTLKSKYSYITYFTDYENNIREEVVNEYEQWENELKEREEALNNGQVLQ